MHGSIHRSYLVLPLFVEDWQRKDCLWDLHRYKTCQTFYTVMQQSNTSCQYTQTDYVLLGDESRNACNAAAPKPDRMIMPVEE